jgi:uncharacterized protein (DUF2336 family)
MLAEDRQLPRGAVEPMARMSVEDPSPLVRMYLASALQRMPTEQRWGVLTGLASRAEDAEDHNLPLMVWYAAEPAVAADLDRGLDMALGAELPGLLPFTVRRVAATGSDGAVEALAARLARAGEAERVELMKGLNLLVHGTEQ